MALFSTQEATENFSLSTQVNDSNPYINTMIYQEGKVLPSNLQSAISSLFPKPLIVPQLQVQFEPSEISWPVDIDDLLGYWNELASLDWILNPDEPGIFGKIINASLNADVNSVSNSTLINFSKNKQIPPIMRGKIAEYAGFYYPKDENGNNIIDSKGKSVIKWSFANMKIDELTYFIVFRITSKMSDGQANNFEGKYSLEERLNDCNKIRLAFWGESGINGRKIKRLHKNGDQEDDQNVKPSSNELLVKPKEYTSKEDYAIFGTVLHYLAENEHFNSFIDDGFLENQLMQIPLEYYLLNQLETRFFENWVKQSYSRPYFPFAAGSIPEANTGSYLKINITSLPISNEDTDRLVFYPEKNKLTYKTPIIKAAFISGTPVSTSIVNIILSGFRKFRQDIIVVKSNGTPHKSPDRINPGTIRISANGNLIFGYNSDIFIRKLTSTGQIGDKLTLDYLKGEYIANSKQIQYDGEKNINFINIYKPQDSTYLISKSIAELGIAESEISNLINYRVYRSETGKPYIIYKQKEKEITTNAGGLSGLTMGLGIDFATVKGVGSHPNDTREEFIDWIRRIKEDEGWSDKNHFPQVMGDEKRGNVAANYWINNRDFFDIDCNLKTETKWNWSRALFEAMEFIDERFYGKYPHSQHYGYSILSYLREAGLYAEPNVIEKFAMLAISWNGYARIGSVKSLLAKAVNQHRYDLLIEALDKVSQKSHNRHAMLKLLKFGKTDISEKPKGASLQKQVENTRQVGSSYKFIEPDSIKDYFVNYHLNSIDLINNKLFNVTIKYKGSGE